MHDLELAKAIHELTNLLREWREEKDAVLLAAELARSAAFTRRLEKVARALAALDAKTPAK